MLNCKSGIDLATEVKTIRLCKNVLSQNTNLNVKKMTYLNV